jgi:hypothetical protein
MTARIGFCLAGYDHTALAWLILAGAAGILVAVAFATEKVERMIIAHAHDMPRQARHLRAAGDALQKHSGDLITPREF